MLTQLLRETSSDRVVRQGLSRIDLSQAGLDLAQKPVLVVDRAFECLAGERLDRQSATVSGDRKLPFQFW